MVKIYQIATIFSGALLLSCSRNDTLLPLDSDRADIYVQSRLVDYLPVYSEDPMYRYGESRDVLSTSPPYCSLNTKNIPRIKELKEIDLDEEIVYNTFIVSGESIMYINGDFILMNGRQYWLGRADFERNLAFACDEKG